MPLQLFGFHTHPNAFAVTKAHVALENCVFLLDFSRPLERIRWLGVQNKWIGATLGLFVPVVHQAEQSGGYVISVQRGEPFFLEIQALWKKHHGSQHNMSAPRVEALQVIADFVSHFPEDSQ